MIDGSPLFLAPIPPMLPSTPYTFVSLAGPMPRSCMVLRMLADSAKPMTTIASEPAVDEGVDLGVEALGVGGIGEELGMVPPEALEVLLEGVGETLTVRSPGGRSPRRSRCPRPGRGWRARDPGAGRTGPCGSTAVVVVGGEVGRRVGRRELDHVGADDLVDDRLRHRRRRRADDHVGPSASQESVDGLVGVSVVVSPESPWLRTTSAPSTPPASLMSWTASSAPAISGGPRNARSPVTGRRVPTSDLEDRILQLVLQPFDLGERLLMGVHGRAEALLGLPGLRSAGGGSRQPGGGAATPEQHAEQVARHRGDLLRAATGDVDLELGRASLGLGDPLSGTLDPGPVPVGELGHLGIGGVLGGGPGTDREVGFGLAHA
jgi:hypothetical protein